ncbi:MAG: hypothetical protein AMJ69_03020 [Gammaproteobacteria bacterium SG8_47]|nr:MAG: hypothetical protein AMJ69_03020 [Gammaproteobacteria bacterium SG8_47]
MRRTSLAGLDRKRLRLWLALFFIALALPTAILIRQAYSQMKWEAFHHYRVLAEELAQRIDAQVNALIAAEEGRGFADYGFLVVAGEPSANFLQRSPLSTYPIDSPVPGLIGHFQIDAQGRFSTPLLPRSGADTGAYGISPDQRARRVERARRLQQILSQNRLAQTGAPAAPVRERLDDLGARVAPSPVAQSAGRSTADAPSLEETSAAPTQEQAAAQLEFDRLSSFGAADEGRVEDTQQAQARTGLGRVEDLDLDYRYQSLPQDKSQALQAPTKKTDVPEKRAARKERSALPEPSIGSADTRPEAEALAASDLRISIFESEIDPFEFSLLDGGHFVLFRKVWRDNQRYIQGALVEQDSFLRGAVEAAFRETALSQMSNLIVAYRGTVFAAFSGAEERDYLSSARELRGALLYQGRLSAPLADIELIFTVNRLPAAAGASVVTWTTLTLGVVLVAGFYLMYRLGAKQIALARQQQDFVSAVSHELKTPLTSIRMYGEMLREGWASADKKQEYYGYIHDESERLSRLINNVLQLARLTRNDLRADLKVVAVAELIDGVKSKVSSQIERAGFVFNLSCDEAVLERSILVDADWFAQMVINLVDNAVKFAAKAERKQIDITCRLRREDQVVFAVRDYGPGVARDQMKKIFKLFYRTENELTRETVGTGIGLALVRQLASAMHAQIDVLNRDPGAEFSIAFNAVNGGAAP